MSPPTYGLSFIDNMPAQRVENKTGMPDQLKSGVEALSGVDMSDVKVNYNSEKPAQLQAHAFAQGNQIHLAPGQEKHLPHEAWHVVQQRQGRVKPTRQLKAIQINDETALEKEADVMGKKASQVPYSSDSPVVAQKKSTEVAQLMLGGSSSASRPLMENDSKSSEEHHIPIGGYGTHDDAGSKDKKEGAPPTSTWNWYELMSDLTTYQERHWMRTSLTGYVKLGFKNHGLDVYITKPNYLLYVAVVKSKEVADKKIEDLETFYKQKLLELLKGEDKIQEYMTEWMSHHLPIWKVIGGVLGLLALTVGGVLALTYIPSLAKWMYLGITAVSELGGLIYIVKWYYNVLLKATDKLLLMSLNTAFMVMAAESITKQLIVDAPIHSITWGALPFGLILSSLFATIREINIRKKRELELEVKARAKKD